MSFGTGRKTKKEIMDGVEHDTAKILENNTVEYTKGDVRVIRLHRTDILTFYPDGKIVFNAGGYNTVTTRDRMNRYQREVRVHAVNRVMYAHVMDGIGGPDVVFKDGMTYEPGRGLTGYGMPPNRNLIKRIKLFAKKMSDSLPLDMPGAGDCFMCQLESQNKTDHAAMGNDHLLSHVMEMYLVPALMWNILLDRGCNPNGGGVAWFWYCFKESKVELDPHSRKTIRQWIYRYMYDRIIDGKGGKIQA